MDKIYRSDAAKYFDDCQNENKRLLDDFYNYLSSSNKSPKTILCYMQKLKVFFSWNYEFNCDKLFFNLKNHDFIIFFGDLRMKYHLSCKSVGNMKAILSSFSSALEVLFEDDYPMFKNRVRNIPVGDITTPKKEKLILNDEIIQKILDELVKKKDYAIACYLALLASSGARKGEVIQFKVDDFSDDNLIFSGLMYKTHKIRSKGKGKTGKIIQRLVLKETFKPYFDLWMKERRDNGDYSEELLTFQKFHKGPYQPIKLRYLDVFDMKISKICGFHFYGHAVRHYFTTKLQRKGFPDNIIKMFLRWESVDMVNVYSDIEEDDKLIDYLEKHKELL